MIKMIVFLPNNGLWNCSNWQLTSAYLCFLPWQWHGPWSWIGDCSQYLPSLGGSKLESFWTLAAVLPALGVIFSTEMLLQCLLHPKMNMRLKFSLPLKEEYLQYPLSWVLSAFNSQAGSLMLCTVHVVECLGMQMVLTSYSHFIFITLLLTGFHVLFLGHWFSHSVLYIIYTHCSFHFLNVNINKIKILNICVYQWVWVNNLPLFLHCNDNIKFGCRWFASFGIEPRSKTRGLFCLVCYSSVPKAPRRCGYLEG